MNNTSQLSLFDFPFDQATALVQSPSIGAVTGACTVQAEDKDESLQNLRHPYIQLLEAFGFPHESMPEPSDKDAVLKALLNCISDNAEQLDTVLQCTDITETELVTAGNAAERKLFYQARARKLERSLAHFCGSEEWHIHGGFWRQRILLTDGVMYLAEHGGRNGNSAFWLMDAIASYQGEKVLAHHPFQVWTLTVIPEVEADGTNLGKCRSARLVCTNGNSDKAIVEQEIEYTDFLLDEVRLYASVEPMDETGKRKQVIILLPSEY